MFHTPNIRLSNGVCNVIDQNLKLTRVTFTQLIDRDFLKILKDFNGKKKNE